MSGKRWWKDRVFVVAEIGSNHLGSLELAKEHIAAAVEAGADAVKFQCLKKDKLYFKPPPDLPWYDFPETWIEPLMEYAREQRVVFFASPTYLEAVEALEAAGVELYKLASPQVAVFPQLVRKVAETGKPALASCGQVGLEGVARLVRIFDETGDPDRLVLLHCNSLYPTPYERVNLPWMQKLRVLFEKEVGFSDHTSDIFIPLAAAALGARVIEKHFILDRGIESPDRDVSLTPEEFKRMVEGIRAVEVALEERPRLVPEHEEAQIAESFAYRLVLKHSKCKGDRFSPGDFIYLRHPEGIDAREEAFIYRFRTGRDLPAGKLLLWEDLAG